MDILNWFQGEYYTEVKIGITLIWFLIYIYPYICKEVDRNQIIKIFTILFVYFIWLMVFEIGTIHQSAIILGLMVSSSINYIWYFLIFLLHQENENEIIKDSDLYKNAKFTKWLIYFLMILFVIFITLTLKQDIEYTFIFM